jgi:hypothetical protein
MPKQAVVRSPSSGMAADHIRATSAQARYEQTKSLVTRNTLPAHKRFSTGDEPYTPPFSTEYAKEIAHKKIPLNESEAMRVVVGAGGVLAAPTIMMVCDNPSTMIVATVTASTALFTSAVFSVPVLARLLKAKIFSVKLVRRMSEASNQPFADWLKARYGIVETEEDQKRNINLTYLTTGVRAAGRRYTFTDKLSGNKYEAHSDADDRIYLVLIEQGTKLAEAPTVLQTPFVASDINRAPSAANRIASALPKEATALRQKLETAIALLKEQELSVELTHQVERTENVVQVVVAKYQHITKLVAIPQANRDLTEFFRTQLAFINGLIREQAEGLMKEMNVEIAAAMEATRVEYGMLEAQR